MLGLNYLAWLGLLVWVVVPLAAWSAASLIWRRSGAVLNKASALAVGFAILSVPALISNGVKAHYDRQVQELCAKDGGIRVYETAPLTPDLMDKAGRIWIPDKERLKSTDEYYYESEDRYYRQGNPTLLQSRYRIIRRTDGKVLGESIFYGRGGGDLPGPWHESSFTCPNPIQSPGLETSIFKGDK
jgi:hypothetical protein